MPSRPRGGCIEEGAAIVDVGGESTRPGSEGVTLDEELRRVVPVLEQLAGGVPVSIDTAKAEVARRALGLGAELVNDVTALRSDPELAGVVAEPARTSANSGSLRSAVTSFTSSAPSPSARLATSAFAVSIDNGTPPASRSSTGTTRRSSSSTETGSEPGLVDSPPTSTIAAPS